MVRLNVTPSTAALPLPTEEILFFRFFLLNGEALNVLVTLLVTNNQLHID